MQTFCPECAENAQVEKAAFSTTMRHSMETFQNHPGLFTVFHLFLSQKGHIGRHQDTGIDRMGGVIVPQGASSQRLSSLALAFLCHQAMAGERDSVFEHFEVTLFWALGSWETVLGVRDGEAIGNAPVRGTKKLREACCIGAGRHQVYGQGPEDLGMALSFLGVGTR